jgi:cytochrome oxidase Cu insertion factor (SCO1/SenC/PrrC family)
MKGVMKLRRLLLPLIALLAGLGWGALWLTHRGGEASAPSSAALALPEGVTVGGPFHLVDAQGHPVSDADLRGRWLLIYFGYTTCPDVCPTTLQTMVTALDKLGPAGKNVVPVFITIDPERDTPDVMGRYAAEIDPRILALSGSPEEIAQVAKAYHVYYAKVPGKQGEPYTMDHSAFIYLVGPDGRLAALFGPQSSADEIAAAISRKLDQPKEGA